MYKDPNKVSRWRIKNHCFTYSSKKEAAGAIESEYKIDVFARERKIRNLDSKAISEAYHKAKSDGSNPELVKAVEDLLGKPKAETPNVEDWSKDVESTAKKILGSSVVDKLKTFLIYLN